MRVVFSSLSSYGHFFPMVPLALAARDAGHDVHFGTAAIRRELLTGLGLTTFTAGRTTDEVVGGLIARLRTEYHDFDNLPEEQRILLISGGFNRSMPQHFLDDLEPVLRDLRPDLLIYGVDATGAGLAAKLAGVPALCAGHGRARSLADESIAKYQEIVRGLGEELGIAVPGDYAMTLGDRFLDIYPPSLQDQKFMAAVPRIELRPVPFNPPGEVPAWVRERSRDRPLVYLTTGTQSDAMDVFRMALTGLASLDVDVLVAAGPRRDPASLGELPDNVVVEGWVPQADLLPYTDLVVHHGADGTTLSAMHAGVPQLFLMDRPGPDQMANAAAVGGMGAGEKLLFEEISVDAVAEKGRRLLGHDRPREGARAIAEEIAAMPSPTEVAARLPELAG